MFFVCDMVAYALAYLAAHPIVPPVWTCPCF